MPEDPLHRPLLVAVSVCLVSMLGGCTEGFPEPQVGAGVIRNAVAHVQTTSPGAARVSMTSLEGAPADIVARFSQVFTMQAADREIVMADSGSAHYLVRGYLSAYPSDSGTDVSYVYDVFDAHDQRRVERVTDVLALSGSGADAWALVDDRVMASLAGRSAEELAAALAATPASQALGSTAGSNSGSVSETWAQR